MSDNQNKATLILRLTDEDREIIANLEIIQNMELLQNMNQLETTDSSPLKDIQKDQEKKQ